MAIVAVFVFVLAMLVLIRFFVLLKATPVVKQSKDEISKASWNDLIKAMNEQCGDNCEQCGDSSVTRCFCPMTGRNCDPFGVRGVCKSVK